MVKKVDPVSSSAELDAFRLEYEYGESRAIYACALNLVRANIENMKVESEYLDDYCLIFDSYGGIKEFDSLVEKCDRKGVSLDMKAIKHKICDVVRWRIVTPYLDDIYTVFDRLQRMSGFTVIEVVDYVKGPKSNGYMSLHVVVAVQVCFRGIKNLVKVEIQIRDRAMEFWAQTEGMVNYKRLAPDPSAQKDFKALSSSLARVDARIMKIRDFDPDKENPSTD